jgi:hypothetical protein
MTDYSSRVSSSIPDEKLAVMLRQNHLQFGSVAYDLFE